MRLLLDTHVFLWFIVGDPRIIAHEQALRDPANEVFLSVVSIWEVTVNHALGRLSLPASPAAYLPEQRQRHAIASLPLDELSVSHLATLPDLHRDPFDRMLICQALANGLILVTADRTVSQYPVASISVS
jgi:PIN domain nuclease of toxin-antitoxin system